MRKVWNFDVDPQGWTALIHISGFGYVPDSGRNSITGTITGNDSRVMSADILRVKFEAAAVMRHVRMKNGSTATLGQVCFTTDADQTFERRQVQDVPDHGQLGFTEYAVDMSTFAQWTSANALRRLRIDPPIMHRVARSTSHACTSDPADHAARGVQLRGTPHVGPNSSMTTMTPSFLC